ncbi:MAG: hypothetical protein R3B70_38470 [Polyangiaceae bacterium]
MWPGILVGAGLGAVVGVIWLFAPVGSPTADLPTSSPSSPTISGTSAATSADSRSPVTAAPSAAPSSQGTAAESEADYLRRAREKVASSPAEALAMIDAHPTLYPDSRLGQERELTAIFALAALGKKTEARARARLFLTLFPDSPALPDLEARIPDLRPTAPPGP